MRILHIKSNCFQQIPPKNWGAIEKIIWNYKIEAELKGHSFEILDKEEVSDWEKYDIIHCHLYDDALFLKREGIKYFFSFHDHHAVRGDFENSDLFKMNKEAIQGAEIAFVHASYIVDIFDKIPVYLKHGVNTSLYTNGVSLPSLDILCVGNNGYCGEEIKSDRKGFLLAYDVAKALRKNITFVGPTNSNKDFFEQNKSRLCDFPINILYDLNEQDLITQMQSHEYLLHLSEIEAGNPPLTILEALSSGMKVVSSGCGRLDYLTSVNRSVDEAISSVQNLEKKDFRASQRSYIHEKYRWEVVSDELLNHYNNFLSNNFKHQISTLYRKAISSNSLNRYKEKLVYKLNYLDGPKVSIFNEGFEGSVIFTDLNTGEEVYKHHFKDQGWCQASSKYFRNWKINIESKNYENIEKELNLKNKKVLIEMESSSLGDTLAWVPYVEKFKEKHNCELDVFTFHNDLFRNNYEGINFVTERSFDDYHAVYRIGIYQKNNGDIDYDRNPENPFPQPLQKTASDILNLDYEEIRPRIDKPENIIKKKKVCIATQSTSLSKYWNRENGWQDVIQHLLDLGYEVNYISKEDCSFDNVIDKSGEFPLADRVKDICESELFIGLGSGLSWLAWACNTPVVLISGFSEEYTEFKCNRVINNNVCHGCFNHHALDKSDWNYCPNNKNFECTKSISSSMVIKEINKVLHKVSPTSPAN